MCATADILGRLARLVRDTIRAVEKFLVVRIDLGVSRCVRIVAEEGIDEPELQYVHSERE